MRTQKYIKKIRNPYKLYIPENLELEQILIDNPPDFKFHPDYFLYILHLIVSIPLSLKDFDIEEHKGYTPIDKKILSRRIHNYKVYIEYLEANKIIIAGTSYKPGYYSRGLQFTEQYRTRVKGVYISKNTLIKSITKKYDYRDSVAEKKLCFLKEWFNENLTIDMEKVKNFLESDKVNVRKKIKEKRAKSKLKRALIPIEDIILFGNNLKMMVADKINEGIYDRLSVDNTSGRFHSPLTQLKKGLRPFVRYNGETLYGIDIVNSQPLFALIILDFNLFMDNKIYEIIAHYNKTHHEMMKLDKQTSFTNPFSTMLFNLIKTAHTKRDVLNFKRNVAGGYFYENFAAELSLKGLLPIEISNDQIAIRKFAKEAVFTAFFSRTKDCVWNNHIKAFSKCYPTVYKIFTFIKHGANNHPALACLLQRFESKLVLHETCVEINKKIPHIPIFTVHDSIVTTSKYRAIVEQIFKEHLANCLGINPPLKIEAW